MARAAAILLVAAVSCSSPGTADDEPEAKVGRPGPLQTATTAQASTGSPASTAAPTVAASPEDHARAALDVYLDGLASQTFGRAMNLSQGAARRIALIRLVLAEHNRARGAETTVSISERTFVPAEVNAGRVSFRGRASLHSTVTAGDGTKPESSIRPLEDPVVERVGTRWLVTAFAWEGLPVVAHEGGATATVDGVELRLEGSVAFGKVVGVLVLLSADGTRRVRLGEDHLRIGGAEAMAGFWTMLDGQPGLLYLTYPRHDERPDSWRASVEVDDGDVREVTLAF